jgi:type VI protein secretion system component Hcp
LSVKIANFRQKEDFVMAVEIFLNLDGIHGESQKDGASRIGSRYSVSATGLSNPSSAAFGTGSGAGKVDISSLQLAEGRWITASPKLFLNCAATVTTSADRQAYVSRGGW